MPELPEVEIVKQGLASFLTGARIEQVHRSNAPLRFADPHHLRTRLEGSKIQQLDRRAKYLLFHLDHGETLLWHLGMSGQFYTGNSENERAEIPKTHCHVTLKLDEGRWLIYRDVRRFGFIDLVEQQNLEQHPRLASLGIEPLGSELTAELLHQKAKKRSQPIKNFLLDQRIIAGIGNIYASEILFLIGIHPTTACSLLSETEWQSLPWAIRQILEKAIQAGGSTLRDHRQADGNLGYFQHQFQVYGRTGKHCLTEKCGSKIEKITQSGRSSFFCGLCQPLKQQMNK